MATKKTNAPLHQNLVRDFLVRGDGDYSLLQKRITDQRSGWTWNYGDDGILLTTPINLEARQLLQLILETNECGYRVVGTRVRQLTLDEEASGISSEPFHSLACLRADSPCCHNKDL
jgi:hypothetical protein